MNAGWFKSYYVVWKQELFEINRGSFTSLNRTMQYGNPIYPNQKEPEDLV